MRFNHDELEVFISSHSEGNPYEVGERAVMEGSGLYCETVIKTNELLKVPNSLTDEHWQNNPDVKLNMISYLGYPILLPDNTPFGTICVLDNKENNYSEIYENLVINFRDLIEMELALLDSNIKLKESEKQLRDAQKYAHIGYWGLRRGSSIATWSDQMYIIFGLTPNEEPGPETLCDILHSSDCENFMVSLQHSFATGEEHHIEYRITRRNDGEERWIECRGNPVIDSNGEVEMISGFIQDITERKLAEEAIHTSRKHFQTIFEEAPLGVAVIDSLTGHIYDANPAYSKIAGRSIEELRRLDWMTITHPDDIQEDIDNMVQMNAGETSGFTMQKRLIQPDKSVRWINMTITPMLVEDKSKPRHLCMMEDITERKQSENSLRIAATAFESQEGMMVTDANSIILRVNQAFTRITGYSAEDTVGKMPQLLSSSRHDKAFYTGMWDSLNNTGSWDGEIWNRRKSGEVYPEHLAITAVKDATGTVTNYVATLTDITISKAASDEIKNLAFYDPLSKLPNRRLLLDRLNQALAASARSGQCGALLFLDLDHFKSLNDTLGHDIGDLLLQQVAERLTASVREGDTVSRLGGDEFVVLLEDLSEDSMEAAAYTEDVSEKILLLLNEPYQLNTNTHHCTTSIGATVFNGHVQGVEELLKQADIAMYQSKIEGRNTLRFFESKMQEAITAHVNMEKELRKAIEQKQFKLYYQIQVGNTGQAIGAEALIRWQHPERGIVSPLNFIPLTEETGMILAIGEWVLDTACAQLKTWQQNPLTQDLVLAVNVSAKQFFKIDFVEQVKATLQRHEINPARLKLELTESLLVKNINDIISKMDELSKTGIRFSLDDFGTGYSSLQYLKTLPLNQLKIDRSFVRDLVTDASDRAIVRTIITMANSLDLNVIAEGVETAEQRQYLLDNGCTNYQGYLFSKPVPIDEFEALLKKG